MVQTFNVRHLAAFAATVRHGSLTRAARAVNLTQPALTKAIKGLEGTFNTQLFQREADGMRATESALLLAPRAQAAVDQIGSSRVTGTQVRAFLAVARAGSYAAAAEAIGQSPASLHRAVADLSLALGQRLVERRGKGVALTVAGSRRARRFGLAIAELRAGMDEVAALAGRTGGRIVNGAMPLSRARWLPLAIARFAAEYPGIDLAVQEGSHLELVGPLRDGDIDFMLGALRDEGEVEDLAQEQVFDDRPAIVMRAGHPLLSASDPASQLFQYPWIISGRGTPLRRFWEMMARSVGSEPPRVAIECGSVIMLRELLRAGDGLALLSPDQVGIELEAGVLAQMRPPKPVVRAIGIISRKEWRPTAPQGRMIDLLREVGTAQGL